MSVQNLQDIISDLELHNQSLVSQNEDLRYRLSFFSGDQPGSAANLQKLLIDNDSLRKQMDELDLSFQDERRALYDREKAVMRILEQFQIPEEVVEGVRFELEDEREVMKEQVARVEDEVRARDRIIDQLGITLENLRKEYQESCDILTYEMNQKIEDMDMRLRQADHIINQQAAQISKLTSQSQSSLEIEDLYTALIAKYNDQIHLNEELNDKLTATEFDLYATVEKLDLLQISDTVDETAKTKAFMSVAVGTDPDYMDSPILSKDLKRLSDKFESSQYQVSELSIENSALECRVEELEQELSFYKDRTCTNLHSPNPLSESEKLTVLTETNRRLQSQIEAYEDEIFELSEQISLAEADTGPGEKVKVITRRLSTMMEQGPFGKRTPESDLDASAEHLRASTHDLLAAKDRAETLERDLESKQLELEGISTKLSELQSRVDELESAEKDHLEKLDDRKSEIDSLKREISRLKTIEEEHERLKAENARQAEETARKNEVATLNATIANRESEISVLKKQIEDYEKSNAVSKKVLKTLQANVTDLEKRLAEKDSEKAELSRSVSQDFEAELEKEKSRHEAELQKQVGEIEAKLNEKEKLIESLIADLNSAKAEQLNSSRAEVELDNLQKQIESLTGRPTPEDMAEVESNLKQMTEALAEKEAELVDITARHNLKIRDAEEKIGGLEKEVERVQEMLNKETAAKQAAQEDVIRLNTELTAARQDAELELARLTEQLSVETSKTKTAEDKCAGVTREVELLNSKLATSQEECENLHIKNKADGELIETLKHELNAAGETKTSIEHEHEKLKEQFEALQLESTGECIALKANVAALQTEINNIKNIGVSAESKKSEELAALQSEKESLQTEKEELQSQLEALAAEKLKYKEELDAANASQRSVQDQIETLNSDHAKLSEDLATLQEQLAKVSTERDAALSELSLAKEEINQKIEEESLRKSEIDETLFVKEEKVKTLTSSLSDYESQIASYKSKLEEMKNKAEQLDSVNAQLAKSQSEASSLQQKYDELDGEFKAKDSLIKSAQDQNADLLKQLSDANQTRDKIEKSLKNYENSQKTREGKAERQSSKLEKELQDIKAQLNKANKEADSSKKEMKRSKDQLLDVRATLKETQDKLERIAQEKRSLQVQLNTPPTTPSPPPTSVTENGDVHSKNLDKIKSLERQIADMKKHKESKKVEPSPKKSSQTGAVVAAVGLAGVSSALSAYIATLYGC